MQSWNALFANESMYIEVVWYAALQTAYILHLNLNYFCLITNVGCACPGSSLVTMLVIQSFSDSGSKRNENEVALALKKNAL